jgi:hypothetical protein
LGNPPINKWFEENQQDPKLNIGDTGLRIANQVVTTFADSETELSSPN